MPQIFIQSRILYWSLSNDISGINVDLELIMGSLGCALLHGVIEFIFLSLEAKACKTNLIHYSIICFNARFGWIPFSH